MFFLSLPNERVHLIASRNQTQRWQPPFECALSFDVVNMEVIEPVVEFTNNNAIRTHDAKVNHWRFDAAAREEVDFNAGQLTEFESTPQRPIRAEQFTVGDIHIRLA